MNDDPLYSEAMRTAVPAIVLGWALFVVAMHLDIAPFSEYGCG
jgi:hypothetical protein